MASALPPTRIKSVQDYVVLNNWPQVFIDGTGVTKRKPIDIEICRFHSENSYGIRILNGVPLNICRTRQMAIVISVRTHLIH